LPPWSVETSERARTHLSTCGVLRFFIRQSRFLVTTTAYTTARAGFPHDPRTTWLERSYATSCFRPRSGALPERLRESYVRRMRGVAAWASLSIARFGSAGIWSHCSWIGRQGASFDRYEQSRSRARCGNDLPDAFDSSPPRGVRHPAVRRGFTSLVTPTPKLLLISTELFNGTASRSFAWPYLASARAARTLFTRRLRRTRRPAARHVYTVRWAHPSAFSSTKGAVPTRLGSGLQQCG